MLNTNEEVWISHVQCGDSNAFTQLVEIYQRPVFNLCYRMLGERGEAEDAAQETFLRAYTRFASYDSTRKFSSWLLAIATHYCIDRLRQRRLNMVSWEGLDCSNWLPSSRPGPEAALITREAHGQAQDLLNTLPPHYRATVILRYWHDLSYQEIAETLQTTLPTVKSQLFRARQMMARTAIPQDTEFRLAQSMMS
jgi:RNA polymerase sigma-70 factor, ECF subfamily